VLALEKRMPEKRSRELDNNTGEVREENGRNYQLILVLDYVI